LTEVSQKYGKKKTSVSGSTVR